MKKANKLRAKFPTFIGKSNIEVYADEDASKIVTYINVPENRIDQTQARILFHLLFHKLHSRKYTFARMRTVILTFHRLLHG